MVLTHSLSMKSHATQNPSRVVHEEFIQSWVLCTRTPLAVPGLSRRAKTILQSCNTKEYCDEEEVCLSTQRGIMDTIHASPATALQVDNWTSQPRLQCLSVWGTSPLLGFCLGWSIKFVGSESGQIQSVKLLTGLNAPVPSQTHTVCTCCTLTQGKEGEQGRVEPCREKVRGATVHKAGSNYHQDWFNLQFINSAKHLPQSTFTGQFFYMSTFCFGVYVVY